MKDSLAAFHWITNIIRKHKSPFVIVGGLAANAYGSTRPLNDIDIDLSRRALDLILPEISPFVRNDLTNYKDNEFDIELVTLTYKEQEIDLTVAETIKLFDHQTDQWINLPTDLNDIQEIEIFGLLTPVMSKSALVKYKKMISRTVDLEDVLQVGE